MTLQKDDPSHYDWMESRAAKPLIDELVSDAQWRGSAMESESDKECDRASRAVAKSRLKLEMFIAYLERK